MSNPTDRPPAERPQATVVYLGLIDYMLGDPLTAPLADDGLWNVDSQFGVRLIDHAPGNDPLAVLRKLEADLGGKFQPREATDSGLVWHELSTTRDGIQVKLSLAAPDDSEAERYRQGQLDEQRHQVEDAAVPPVLVTA